MKKLFILSALFFCFNSIYAASYKISDVKYDITGITREYSLKTKIKFDFKKVFDDEDSLMSYLGDIKTQIENTRTFEEVNLDFSMPESPDKDDIYPVSVLVTTKDTMHLLATPYPKYKSGDTFSIMLKIKDTNFLGSMETLTGDVNFGVELNDDDTPKEYKFGFNVDFDTPFKMGPFESVWANSLAFSYTIGNKIPEWNAKTGLKLSLPFDSYSFVWAFYQSSISDHDYEEKDLNGTKVHYGDGIYFVEKGEFSIPIILQKVPNWGNIVYTPYVECTYNWDFDGIDSKNDDLLGPCISFGQKISTERINWIENFRDGLSASINQSFGYNFNDYGFNPGISGELKAFKAFEHFGLSTDIYAFAYMNGSEEFGSRLRGIRDNQYFDSEEYKTYKACKSSAAFVMNFDAPIKLGRIYWENVPVIRNISFARYFNMEIQVSPFIDVALFKNKAAGTTFNIKDSFIAGGLEGIIYPLKFKGIQVRGSFGIDLTRKMPVLKGKVNQDWRDSVSSYELTIGIGLHY